MAKTREPEGLARARAEVQKLSDHLVSARHNVEMLEAALGEAHKDLREEQLRADEAAPQCRLVRVKVRSGDVEELGRVVIVKKTGAGVLVTRMAGQVYGPEYRFKLEPGPGGMFRQMLKKGLANSSVRELRDVPVEYSGA